MTAAARPFQIDRNLRLLYALGVFTMAQPGLLVWVAYLLSFRHLTLTQVGIMEAFFWGVKLVIEVPSGAIADRFGRRAAFWLGLTIEAAGVATFAFASNFSLLLLSYVLWSGGFSFRSGNDHAYLYDALATEGREAEFSSRAGVYGALTTGAFMLAGIGGAWLAAVTNLQIAMAAGVLPYILGAVALAAMAEPPRAQSLPKETGHLSYVQTLRDALSLLRRNRLVLYALLSQVFVETGLIATMLLAQPFLLQHRVGLAWFGLLQAPAALAGALASIGSARAAALIGIHRLTACALSLMVGGLLLLALVDHVGAFAGFIGVQFALGLVAPAIGGYVNDRTESNIRATIMSVVPLGTSATYMLVGPFAGTVGDISLRLAFGAMAAIILLPGAGALLLWRAAERKVAPVKAAP